MSHATSENKLYGGSTSFQLPQNDNDSHHYGISPSELNNMTFWSNGSSFSSSASGSGAGGSFSSVDNLPSISRDFARPSESDTRRPATAGGALQPSRNMFSTGLEATIQEEEGSDNQETSTSALRRASVPHDTWLNNNSMSSTHSYNQFMMPQQPQSQMSRNNMQVSRPQTSDGLPHHTMVPSLPSLNSHVQFTNTIAPRALPNTPAMQNMGYSSFPGDRTFSFSGGIQPQFINTNAESGSSYSSNDARKHTFVPTDEDRPKPKRPRRRADEITRKYKCGWNGCDKGYGTLNHLNAHVETLKHGEKRTSDEFKWIKEQNKAMKQQAAAEAARHKSARTGPDRGSVSSSTDSDYGRRDSAVSTYSSADYSGRSSINSNYGFVYDTRPGTAGSMASFDGNSSSAGYPDQFAFGGQMNRRPSAPMHIPLPPPRPINQDFGMLNAGQFLTGDHLTPTNQYPHSHLNLGDYRPQAQVQGQNSTISMSSAQPLEKPFEQFSFQR